MVKNAFQAKLKRLFDIVLSIVLVILLGPAIVIVGILVAIFLGRPILFSQVRIGQNEKRIKIFKFRSMTNRCDENGELLSDAMRLSPFGAWLRKTSLDELPQLYNVLRGDISLVGPRPLLVEYLPLYNEEQKRRHEVRPGITGWAQVNGRNAISWQDKFKLDVWYVDNTSLWLDFKILCKTVLKVVKGSDVSQTGNATMEKFQGNEFDV